MGLLLAFVLSVTAAMPVGIGTVPVSAAVEPGVPVPDAAKLFGEDGNPKDGISSLTYSYSTQETTGRYLSSVAVTVADYAKFTALLDEVAGTSGISMGSAYLTSISAENGNYSGSHYLSRSRSGYTVVQPKWFEGPQTVRMEITLDGSSVNYNITLPREAPPVYTSEQEEQIRDYLYFGNTESEAANQYEGIRVNNAATNIFEGQELTYRTLQPRGSMAVNLKCDPEKQNYFTVKLWGNDTNATADGMLWVADPQTNCIGVSPYGNAAEAVNVPPNRSGGVDRKQYVDLSFLSDAPQCENGFIYSTYKIPKQLTAGKKYVSLRLYSTGDPGEPIKEQTGDSRRIYAAYMTQEAQFSPEDFAAAGETAVRGSVTIGSNRHDINDSADIAAMKQTIGEYAVQEIELFKNRQVYSGNRYLPCLKGMLTRNTSASTRATDKNSFTGEGNGMNAQNMTPLNGLEAFAYAYAGNFYTTDRAQKAELLDRTVSGFDFLTRAQGSNGGLYQKSDGVFQWIGGPNRLPSQGNNLTGFGLRAVGKAFLILHEANAAALEDTFETMIDTDADDNNRVDQKRVLAYAALFSKVRDFLESPAGSGHAPNQDMADIIALLRFDQSLAIIDDYIEAHPDLYPDPSSVTETTFGEYSWPFAWEHQDEKQMTLYPGTDFEKQVNGPERVKNSIDIGLGIAPNISTYSYWVSPKGLILENFGSINGGFTGDYGSAAVAEVSQIVEMAAEHYYPDRKEDYWEILNQVYDTISNFYFIENDGGNHATLYAEGIIGERNPGYPGVVRYALDEYGATGLNDGKGNIQALKIMQYYLEHGRIDKAVSGNNLVNSGYAHFEDDAIENIKLYYSIEDVVSRITDEVKAYEFPANLEEVQEPTAWADEMGHTVTVNFGKEKLFFNLNYRTWMHSQKTYTHDQENRILPTELTRFHRKNGVYDNYGYASTTVYGWSRANPTGGWNYSNDYIEAMFLTRFSDELTILMNTTGCGLDYCGKGNPIDYTGGQLDLDLKPGEYVDLISGQEYTLASQKEIDALSIPHNTTMVLMYKEALAKHTVTYVAEDGSNVPTDENEYSKGSAVTVSEEIPTRDGYEFTGWLNSLNGQMAYPGGSFVMGEEDVTLTAIWAKLYDLELTSDHPEGSDAAGTLELYENGLPLSGRQIGAGRELTVMINPAEGSRLLALEKTEGETTANVTTSVDANTYTFTMPESPVSILALFTETDVKESSVIAVEDRGFRINNRNIKGNTGNVELRNQSKTEVDHGFVAAFKFDLSDVLADMKPTDQFLDFRLQLITEWAQGTDEYKTHNVTLFSNDWAESPDNTNQYDNKASLIDQSVASGTLAQIHAKGNGSTMIYQNMVENDVCSLEQYRSVSGNMADAMNQKKGEGLFQSDQKLSFLVSSSAAGDSVIRFMSKDTENSSRTIDGDTYRINDLIERYHAEESDFKPKLLIRYGSEQPDVQEESDKALEDYHNPIPVYRTGDTNNDGSITAVDALIALQFSVGEQKEESFTNEQIASYRAAKVTGGETVTTADVLQILEAAANHRSFD